MKGASQRLAVVVAGLLFAGFAGCSGSGGKDDAADPFKPPPSDAPFPPVRTSFKVRARLQIPPAVAPRVAISPDGKLAVSSGDKALHFWSIPEAREVRTLEVLPAADETGRTGQVLFSPDGKWVATVVPTGPELHKPRLFQMEGGKEVSHPIPPNYWDGIALSPDGNLVAVTGAGEVTPGNDVQVWDLRRSRMLHRFACEEKAVGNGNTVAFSPDAASLAVGFHWFGRGDRESNPVPLLQVWDLRTEKEVLRGWSGGEMKNCEAVAFSPDGRLLAAGGGGRDGLVQLWDVASKRLLHQLVADKGHVYSLAFHPSGQVLATGGNDSTIKLWDVNKGTLIRELAGHTPLETGQAMRGLAFSRDGKVLLSVSRSNQLLIWDAD